MIKRIPALTTHYSIEKAIFFAELSRLAYLDPPSCRAALSREYRIDKVKFLENESAAGFTIRLGSEVIIVFRGTDDLKDWMQNANAGLIDEANGSGRVHAGFKETLDLIWRPGIKGIDRTKDRVWITGHSLGAAMASIAAARYRYTIGGLIGRVYLFGSPRVGDKQFSKSVQDIIYRHTNNNDVVCRVPPAFFGYRHTGKEVYITANGELKIAVSWYDKIRDRISGRIKSTFIPGFDGIADHNIGAYEQCLERAKADSSCSTSRIKGLALVNL